MKVVVTGATGFLGWHTRVRLRAGTEHEVIPVDRDAWDHLNAALRDADAVIHVAGVNRGADVDVERGNVDLATDVATAIGGANRPVDVVYADSIQSGNGTAYGRSKAAAAEILGAAAEASGSRFVDLRLPNLFGERGRPAYNSFVATFVRAVVDGATPIIQDRPVGLLHVQRAAEALVAGLVGDVPAERLSPTMTTVHEVWERLAGYHALYAATGDIPPLDSDFAVDLFNTYRARLFPTGCPIGLVPHMDDRGRLVEAVRTHGGTGQTFVSTTRPGAVRGEHFHLRKIERFVVLSGKARISLRRCLSTDVVNVDVRGDRPVIVDMPTMWVHNITNTGEDLLTTLFWAHELFDPAAPDTYPETVAVG